LHGEPLPGFDRLCAFKAEGRLTRFLKAVVAHGVVTSRVSQMRTLQSGILRLFDQKQHKLGVEKV
jgi:hypothetical protein